MPLNIVQDNQKNIKPPVTPQQPPQTANQKRGILGNILPIGGAVLGGIVGGAVSTPETLGVGTVSGSVAGSSVGGAIGETAQQGIENLRGTRKGLDTKQIGQTGLFSGVADLGSELVAPIAKLGLKAISFLGNVPEELLLDAIKNPKLYSPGFKGGQDFLSGVVKSAGDNLGKYSSQLTEKIGSMLKPIAQIPIQGGEEAVTGLVDKVTQMLSERNMTPSGMAATTKQFIGDIPLQFEGKTPSSVVNQGERKVIQTAYNLVNGLREELPNAAKLNAVKQTLNELWGNMSDGSAKKLVGSINHEVGSFIDQFHPQLAQVRQAIHPAEMLLNNIREIIPQKAGKNMTAEEIDSAKANLLNLIGRTGSEAKKAVEQYSKETGSNIMQDVGGAKLAGVKLEGMAKIPPGSVSQLTSKFVRLIPQELAKLPVRFADATEFIGKMIQTGVPDAVMKTVLQSLYTKKKQNQSPTN